MASDNESVADIIKEMRDGKYPVSNTPNLRMIDYANRLEAAHKREVAGLRECLKEAICVKCNACREWYRNCPTICDVNKKDCEIIAKWRKALEGAKEE